MLTSDRESAAARRPGSKRMGCGFAWCVAAFLIADSWYVHGRLPSTDLRPQALLAILAVPGLLLLAWGALAARRRR